MKKAKTVYFNRELSWLAFNERVLDQASLTRHPLLERVKFLAISAANLDEFFMVRVGGLRLVSQAKMDQIDIAGLTADQQLKKIRDRVTTMYASQSHCLNELCEELKKHGIQRIDPASLSDSERQGLLERFQSETVSAVAPIAFENINRLSMLRGARLAVCVRLKNDPATTLGPNIEPTPVGATQDDELDPNPIESSSEFRYVLLALGQSQSRFWTLPSEKGYRYLLIEDVVEMFLSEYFDPSTVVECTTLRTTQNGDIEFVDDGRADLMGGMEAMLEARKTSGYVRLELSNSASEEMRSFLESALQVATEDVYLIDGPIALSDYFGLAGIGGFTSLKDVPWTPQLSPAFINGDIFESIREQDRLLYHPYQSYDPIVEFVRSAANDPEVIAIKQTLYRASKDSQIIESLKQAAANGKSVTVIVELKARFDEASNIYWAKQLEQVGVDVIYGVRGLKTHAKMCLVVRRERTGIRRYVHFATGNYNESTARLYSDVSLFTCDEQLGSDAVHFFNAITGLSVPHPMSKLAAAPINLRQTLLDLIKVETEAAKSGNHAEITAKFNSLTDQTLIDALYEASQAGVKIRLNIRGICCLVPGQKGLSSNIKVISVVDRMLEHARIFQFRHGGDELLFISSADWMGRNLDRRVELMTPVLNSECKNYLIGILDSYFQDNVAATELQSDGSYTPVAKKKKKPNFRSQAELFAEAKEIYSAHVHPGSTVFEPHRAEK